MKQKHFFKYEKWNTKTGIKRTVHEGTSTSRQDGVTETRFNLFLRHPKEEEKKDSMKGKNVFKTPDIRL